MRTVYKVSSDVPNSRMSGCQAGYVAFLRIPCLSRIPNVLWLVKALLLICIKACGPSFRLSILSPLSCACYTALIALTTLLGGTSLEGTKQG